MFTIKTQFNEGQSIKNVLEERKKLLNEGENPKANTKNDALTNWQEARTQTYANHNWEKLRK